MDIKRLEEIAYELMQVKCDQDIMCCNNCPMSSGENKGCIALLLKDNIKKYKKSIVSRET